MPSAIRQRPDRGSKKSTFVEGIEAISKPTEGIKIGFYGKTATGKTTLFSTFPKPSLLIRAEKGTRSIYNVKGVFTTPLMKDANQLLQVIEYAKGKKFATVCLDTVTSYQDLVLRGIIQRDIPEQLGFAEVGRDEWGECALTMKERLREFLELSDIGVNVVVLGQERNFTEEESSDVLLPTVSFRVTPSIADWLNPELDYICQTFKKQVREKVVTMKGKKKLVKYVEKIGYCLRTGPHPIYVTKFRVPRGNEIPEFLVSPSYEDLVKIID